MRGGSASLSLRLHLPLEPLNVDLDALLAGHLLGHLKGEAVGVPQPKDDFSRQVLCPFQRLRQKGIAVFVNLLEALLLQLQDRQHEIPVISELWIRLAHLFDRRLGYLAEERVFETQVPPMPYGPPDHPSKDVSAPLVARNYAVGDEKR